MSGEIEKQVTWVMVKDGGIVENHKIECSALAQLLLDIQRAYDNIGQSKYGKDYIKEECRLFIGKILPGSVALPLTPATYSPRLLEAEPSPYLIISETVERLIDTLNVNPNQFKPLLETEVIDPLARIGVLKSLRSLASSPSLIHIKTAIQQPSEGHYIASHHVGKIDELLIDYEATGEITLQGIIVGFHGEKAQHFFTIKIKNGKNIRCYYDSKYEDTVKNFIHKWVSVTGNAVQTQKSYKLESINSISEHLTEDLSKIGEYILSHPIEFQLSYDKEDNLWGLVNEELALYGYGETYQKTLKSLEEEIEGHVLSFTNHPENQHTQESLIIKNKLKELVNFADVIGKMKEKYGET